MKTILCGLFSAWSAVAAAQISRPVAIIPIQTAAYHEHFTDIFSSKLNLAVLPSLADFQFGAWAEKKYLLPALQQYSIMAGAATGQSGWAISADHTGLDSFREYALQLAYGRRLGKVSLGTGLHYGAKHVAGYGNRSFWSMGIGVLWKVSSVISTGWQLNHLSGGIFSAGNKERLAYGYTAGLGVLLAPALLAEMLVTKNEAQAASVIAACHYQVKNRLQASVQLDIPEAKPSMRVKWKMNWMQLGVTAAYHAMLGFSPGLFLLVETSNEKP
ncbi:hypothetical protein HHL16_17590 [Pseudoflavitalea sp. G-6-1-2]|uniref:hypothetical protein n=1 Tax=Pseudoflavitalea sp. G-6-1-2 TaxID=2728841 RepID=UPI00146ACE2E|nr:hypothetical protein [Pseudoflavitalea sp. G-6-1-2]NML22701.1 hypothetical protein [Pseudoflavitalea sp. G-6-1-2]